MRQVNVQVLSGSDTGDVTGSLIDSNQLVSVSFHAVFGDNTAVGTVKIQGSNDVAPIQYTSASTYIPTNWTDIPNASAAISAGGTALITIPQTCYRWLRATYTRTSGGSSTVIVNMFGLSM